MIETEEGGTPPRYELIQPDGRHYDIWRADRIARCDNRADANRLIEKLRSQGKLL